MIQCDYIYSNVIAHINDYHPDQTKLMDTKRMKWQSIRKIFLMYAEQPFKVMYATAILPLVRRGAQLPLLGKVFCSDNICNDTGLNHKTMCHRITSTEDGKPIILILTQPQEQCCNYQTGRGTSKKWLFPQLKTIRDSKNITATAVSLRNQLAQETGT